MTSWLRIVRWWLPGALVLTIACGFTYVAVQQVYRQGADDPQIQMAADAAARLDAGADAASVVPSETVDVAQSLAVFVIVYSADDAPVASSARLDGATPTPPTGVLEAARTKGENRVTWQPQPGVRIASVEVAAADGRVVLAGRSLREAEARVDRLTQMAGLAWLGGLFALLVVTVVFDLIKRHEVPSQA